MKCWGSWNIKAAPQMNEWVRRFHNKITERNTKESSVQVKYYNKGHEANGCQYRERTIPEESVWKGTATEHKFQQKFFLHLSPNPKISAQWVSKTHCLQQRPFHWKCEWYSKLFHAVDRYWNHVLLICGESVFIPHLLPPVLITLIKRSRFYINTSLALY